MKSPVQSMLPDDSVGSLAATHPPRSLRVVPQDQAKPTLSHADKDRLQDLFGTLEHETRGLIGYPVNANFDYSPLLRLLQYAVNNVGDPFAQSAYRINTHDIEVEVIQFFADLFHAPEDDRWGYVTNGGTEGNLYAMFLARSLHPNGVVFYSEDAHYSIPKSCRITGATSVVVRSLPSGEIDCEDLAQKLQSFRDTPIILFANVGTTMKGAVDDVRRIVDVLDRAGVRERYIHCDAALSGMVLPFVDDAPVFDFRLPIDSISVSGHKMMGSPIPCGVVIARKTNVDRIAHSIEYIGTSDTTISGSRNGITPVFLWYAIRSAGIDGLRAMVARCLTVAAYAEERIRSLGVKTFRNPASMTVVFERPPAGLLRQYSIAVEGDIAHLIAMPHVTQADVDLFVERLRAARSKPDAGWGEAA